MFINLITHGCLNCNHGSGVYVNRFNRDRGLATTTGIQVTSNFLLSTVLAGIATVRILNLVKFLLKRLEPQQVSFLSPRSVTAGVRPFSVTM